MTPKCLKALLAGAFLAALLSGCARMRQAEFRREIALVIKAGQGKLTPDEKESMAKTNHPLLLQLADPNTSKLIALFANLPPHSQAELLEEGYLKWKFAALDPERQQVWRDLVQVNIDLGAKQGATPNPSFSQARCRRRRSASRWSRSPRPRPRWSAGIFSGRRGHRRG